MPQTALWLGSPLLLSLSLATPSLAQSITAAPDGTGTLIQHHGNTYHIQGGTQAGANLFHSFQALGLSPGEIADFLSNPGISNILGRVTGGEPSVIDGLIQVTGANSNLYLMNPAGIVFGQGASLNVGGDFTATTADRIGFAEGWFQATGANDYASLVGAPNQFAFASAQPGAILNFGDLTTENNVSLVGGTVLNQGRVVSKAGTVAIAAVPGERLVKLSQPGMLLSLELPTDVLTAEISPVDLPTLLTGADALTQPSPNGRGLLPSPRGRRVGEEGNVIINGEISGQHIDLYAADQVTPRDPGLIQGDTRVIRFSDQGTNPNQAVFIDRRADNPEQLLYGAASGTVSQIIEPDEHGVSVINEQLAVISESVGKLESVAIVAEGNEGNFWLGSQWITSAIIGDYSEQLQSWGDSLAQNADILLYSCFTALGETGEALMQGIATLTGADVAASVDATGSASYGGDWALEWSSGEITAGNPFTLATLADWEGKLAMRTVTSLADTGAFTLRDALTGSGGGFGAGPMAGDEINFNVSGSINLASEIQWSTANLTIDGVGQTVVLDGGGAGRVFHVLGGATNTTIKNVTIQNAVIAAPGGGILMDVGAGALTLDGVTLQNNTASLGGGVFSFADVSINHSTITNNMASANGGGLGIVGNTTITNSTITNNSAGQFDGGISSVGNLAISNSTVANNVAGTSRGNIGVGGGASVTITDAPGDVNLDGLVMNAAPLSVSSVGSVSLAGATLSDSALSINSGGSVTIAGAITTNGRDTAIAAADAIDLSTLTFNAITGSNGGDITLTAGGNIQTRGLFAAGLNSGGDITLTSQNGQINTLNGSSGAINTQSTGNAGQVTLKAKQGITAGFINTESSLGAGGAVTLESEGLIRLTGSISPTISQFNAFDASIASAGLTAGGPIQIRHGGNGLVAFTVGDASLNGTAAAITAGNGFTILPTQAFLLSQTQPGIEIVTGTTDTSVLTAVAGSQVINPPLDANDIIQRLASQADAELVLVETDAGTRAVWTIAGEATQSTWTTLEDNDELSNALTALDESFNTDFDRLNFNSQETTEITEVDPASKTAENEQGETQDNVTNIRETFSRITEQTGTNPVLVYALSQPEALELILVTADSQLFRTIVPEAQPEPLQRTIRTFRRRITRVNGTGYLEPAQQLYNWVIRPLEGAIADLENVDTLVFAMGEGLRTLPLAALHDGEQFLVETYSLGQIPSMSLIDSSYVPLQDANILAMGASEFNQLNPLPAVPSELALITQKQTGEQYLNQAFTWENLKTQSRDRNFDVVHLATHASFQPGAIESAYIQLWGEEQVDMNRLRELRWFESPTVELLVLSACETAFDDPYAELGFAGLAVQSGVKSALASLWQVSDVGTLALMNGFYDALGNPDVTIKAEALRQAQLALLQGGQLVQGEALRGVTLPPELARYEQTDLSHPYYWSAFTLVGSPW
ncbi:MAG: CHAT domain-containing protein [Spirulina sp. SIO3F2]|nr:CHAT domain-containing protein [Spirulina sp. SIO3F2]